ncbi:hypothetical protein CY34DRAFT_12978 [Suillus luteus UH-Slu-Lm8-n1]|uniref:Uncharacterized protein n=1 Tax=Suillus luteus UH-Slu-Lm8-n1 TaxID=930992 RepID=A0A0D0B4X3_9AGAM|nr:hypothetical protein CY34DRAFT_12978 [Suillus luteus UH-Slu-Lm8-n1]
MRDTTFISHLFLALGTADGPGLTYLNGLIGHHSKNGCRLYCGVIKLDARTITQPTRGPLTISLKVVRIQTLMSGTFPQALQRSTGETWCMFLCRLDTGIAKPSMFLGFSADHTFGIPKCFGSDIMHLISLNIPDLLIPLWRGTFECNADDDKSTWTWAVLTGNIWKDFGKAVAATTPHLPGFFDRPPHNPAKKINSGYKAWEFTLLLYGIGPLVLHNVLPLPYWQHFCKLVRAVCIISQHNITREELQVAARLFVEFIEEFEELYYQCRLEQIHFWTMERTIGNLVMCHSSRSTQRIDDYDPDYNKLLYPRWLKDLGGGYALLKLQECCRHDATFAESLEIKAFLDTYYPHSPEHAFFDPHMCFRVCRWARLRLPNGQTCRSVFSQRETQANARHARNVKLSIAGVLYFAEVLFFFEIRMHPDIHDLEPLALITIYSPPDRALLQDLSNTFYTCTHHGEAGLRVVRVPSIQSIVAMVPHMLVGEERFYMFEKPGMDLANLGGILWDEDEDDNQLI